MKGETRGLEGLVSDCPLVGVTSGVMAGVGVAVLALGNSRNAGVVMASLRSSGLESVRCVG